MATVSHELRTPLNAIINMPRILVDSLPPELADDADRLEQLTRIEQSGHHLLRMINEIIDFNRLEAGVVELQLSEVSLTAVANQVVADMQVLLDERGVQVSRDFDERGARTTGDRYMLAKIVDHLLSNAIKFSPAGAAIEIIIALGQNPPDGGEEIVLRVRDHGVGIAPSARAFIFDGFRQTSEGSHRSHSGTGLGLAVTRRLVELHGGHISLQSELGEGTTVEVRLPR